MKLKLRLKGSELSGHHGHAGRPGQQGGSLPGVGGAAVSGSSIRKNSQVRNFLGSAAKITTEGRKIDWATYTTLQRSWPGGRTHEVSVYAKTDGGYKVRLSGSPSKKYQAYRGLSSWGAGDGATMDEAIKNAFSDVAKTLKLPSAEQVDAAPEKWQ